MSKIIVRNVKTGQERPMTQKSFDYLSSKGRGFEFVGKAPAEPGSIEAEKERLKAEKAAREVEPPVKVSEPEEHKGKPGRKPKAV